MGNIQKSPYYLNIIVFDIDKTQYIENIFKPLEDNYCSIKSIQSKILKVFNSSPPYVSDSIPLINDLQWNFYFITNKNENENEMNELFEKDLQTSKNNATIIIWKKEITKKNFSSFVDTKRTFFILSVNKDANTQDLFYYIPQKELKKLYHNGSDPENLKLDLLKIYSYYNELGDIFSFPQNKNNNQFLGIKEHIISQNDVNYFHYHNIKEKISKNSCLGILVIGPEETGKSLFINISLGEERAKVRLGGLGGTSKKNEYIHSKYPICFYDIPGININNKEDFNYLDKIIDENSSIKCVIYFLKERPRIFEYEFFKRIDKKERKIFLVSQKQINFSIDCNECIEEGKFFQIDLLNLKGIRKLYKEVSQTLNGFYIGFSNVFISEENEKLKQYFKDKHRTFFHEVVDKSLKLFHSYLCYAINHLEELDLDFAQKNVKKYLTKSFKLLSYITQMFSSIAETAGEKLETKEKIKEKIGCLCGEVTESLSDDKIIEKRKKYIKNFCNEIGFDHIFSEIINKGFSSIPSIRIIYNFGVITLFNYYKGLVKEINLFEGSGINMRSAVKGLSEIANKYN